MPWPRQVDLLRVESGSARAKAAGTVAAFDDAWGSSVLDVGCRTMELREALNGRVTSYKGLDLHPPADIVANLDDGIPLSDASVDTVVALDVLEHTERIHAAFAELVRVSRRHVIVSLPNCYDVGLRARFIRGRPLSAKYGLPLSEHLDRHRWLFSLEEARTFCRAQAAAAGWRVVQERAVVGPNRARIGPLVRRWPNLLGSTLMVHLARR